MTREQARAILAHLDLIRHYAEGGDVGLRMHDYRGTFLYTAPVRHICLTNMREDSTQLVRLKPKLAWNKTLGAYERKERAWPEKVSEQEIFEQDRRP